MERIKQKFQAELAKFAQQKLMHRRLWNIPEKSAELLYFLVLTAKPQQILEIGTSNGYSTFWLSLAADRCGAYVTSLEADQKRYLMAVENLRYRNNVKLMNCKAEDMIPQLPIKFDFVFIDAGKVSYIDYLHLLIKKLSPEAIIVADNVISHTETVKEYLDYIKSDPRFANMTLPLETGWEISVFKADPQRL